MRKLLFAVALCAAVAAGCGKQESPAPVQKPPEPELLIGLIPERNIFKQMERYEPLADYLSKKVGVRIKLKVLTLYGNVIDNFEAGKLDGAFFGSFTYSLAHARLGVNVLARPEEPDGTSMYRGYIFARKDSRIRTVRQMKGKRLALVARATTAGYLFPSIFLGRAGVRTPETFFREIYYAGTHEGTIDDVLDRKADVGVSKNTVYNRFAAENPRITRDRAGRSELVVPCYDQTTRTYVRVTAVPVHSRSQWVCGTTFTRRRPPGVGVDGSPPVAGIAPPVWVAGGWGVADASRHRGPPPPTASSLRRPRLRAAGEGGCRASRAAAPRRGVDVARA